MIIWFDSISKQISKQGWCPPLFSFDAFLERFEVQTLNIVFLWITFHIWNNLNIVFWPFFLWITFHIWNNLNIVFWPFFLWFTFNIWTLYLISLKTSIFSSIIIKFYLLHISNIVNMININISNIVQFFLFWWQYFYLICFPDTTGTKGNQFCIKKRWKSGETNWKCAGEFFAILQWQFWKGFQIWMEIHIFWMLVWLTVGDDQLIHACWKNSVATSFSLLPFFTFLFCLVSHCFTLFHLIQSLKKWATQNGVQMSICSSVSECNTFGVQFSLSEWVSE